MTNQRNSIFEIAKTKNIFLDEGQTQISSELDQIKKDFNNFPKRPFFSLFKNSYFPKGLYIYGGVGRGKSMIMDIFFQNTQFSQKRRLHFHDFMREVHEQIFKIGKNNKKVDPVQIFANRFTKKTKLLCFDEMEIRDIADAMILFRLFKNLFSSGITLVTTSNQPPKYLYKNGLHRDRFLPFIDLLHANTNVSQIKPGKDWRKSFLKGKQTWLYPNNASNEKKIFKILNDLTNGFEYYKDELVVSGRKIDIPNTVGGIAVFDFRDLCEQPLAAADYIKLADKYKGFLIKNIPNLGNNKNNEARRFMWLIDSLYDRRCFLLATSEVKIEKLYNGTEWKFEFSRTTSRLIEMSKVIENSN